MLSDMMDPTHPLSPLNPNSMTNPTRWSGGGSVDMPPPTPGTWTVIILMCFCVIFVAYWGGMFRER